MHGDCCCHLDRKFRTLSIWGRRIYAGCVEHTSTESPTLMGTRSAKQSRPQQCAPAAPDASVEASDAGARAVPVAHLCAAPYAGDGGAAAGLPGPASVSTHASILAPAEAHSCLYFYKRHDIHMGDTCIILQSVSCCCVCWARYGKLGRSSSCTPCHGEVDKQTERAGGCSVPMFGKGAEEMREHVGMGFWVACETLTTLLSCRWCAR